MKLHLVQDLIFGHYNQKIILEAVNNQEWQTFRISLKSRTTYEKIKLLREWLKLNNFSNKTKIQITNYVNALKRGGQIK